jgi:hypothetical protein
MFVISNKQFQLFGLLEFEKFIKNSIKELHATYPELTEGLETEELKTLINDVIAVCKQNNVKTEDHVFSLIVSKLKYKYVIPLNPALKKILLTTADERLRVENFLISVANKRYDLIEMKQL